MQGSMIICLFSCLIHAISCWSFQADLSSMLVSSLPHNLTGFSTAYNSLLNQLVIYSGTSNGTYSTTTYVFNLTDYSLKKIEQAVDEVRYKASILAHQNQLYLFGGHKINSTSQVDSGEFWKLDLVTFEWKNIESQLQPYRFCKMIYDNSSILIFGASFHGMLHIFSYQPVTGAFQKLTILFQGQCVYSVKQWDGSVVNLTIPIEDCPSKNSSQVILSSKFPTESARYIDLMQTGAGNQRILQTQDNMYSYQFNPENSTVVIRFFDKVDKQYGNIFSKSVKYNSWNIFCNLNINNRNFYVTFVQKITLSQLRVTQQTPNFYSKDWPDFTGGYDDFCLILIQQPPINKTVDAFITLLIHGSLKIYTLHHDVFLNTTSRPPGLANSTFGLNQCHPGWTGPNCTMPACPNSLQINGANGLAVIRLECSGNGYCNTTGCSCNPLWGGQDCSIYLPPKCVVKLQDNFPLNNCECQNSTVGGNDCTVIFCPGDCFGHGKCEKGVCICDQNFYGADCSTMVVGFPR